MTSAGTPLKNLTLHFGNGVQTGADSVFVLDAAEAAEMEPAALTPFLRGRDVKRGAVSQDPAHLIFPYRSDGGRYRLLTEAEMAQWPKVWAHLSRHRAALEKIAGVGDARIEKYGAKMLEVLSRAWAGTTDEAGRKPV